MFVTALAANSLSAVRLLLGWSCRGVAKVRRMRARVGRLRCKNDRRILHNRKRRPIDIVVDFGAEFRCQLGPSTEPDPAPYCADPQQGAPCICRLLWRAAPGRPRYC